MDLIDKLPDLQSKKDYLPKLKESLTQTNRFEINLKDYKSTYNYCKVEFNQPFCWFYSVPICF